MPSELRQPHTLLKYIRYQLYSDVLLHLRPGHFAVDVNYLPPSVNTAGRRGVFLVYINVMYILMFHLYCVVLMAQEKQCVIAAAYWLVSL